MGSGAEFEDGAVEVEFEESWGARDREGATVTAPPEAEDERGDMPAVVGWGGGAETGTGVREGAIVGRVAPPEEDERVGMVAVVGWGGGAETEGRGPLAAGGTAVLRALTLL